MSGILTPEPGTKHNRDQKAGKPPIRPRRCAPARRRSVGSAQPPSASSNPLRRCTRRLTASSNTPGRLSIRLNQCRARVMPV